MLHALVIGIDSYRDERIAPLRYAKADAAELARLLRTTIEDCSVRLLLDEQATRSSIVKAVGEELPRVQEPDDFILIYFAGHGSPEREFPPDPIARYLVPHDAEYERIFATCISLETELTTLLERQRTYRVLVILDACFSGMAGGRTFLGPSLARALSQFRGARLTLRNLDLGLGKAILAACKDDQLAREDARLGHGLLTYFLLRALSEPGEPVVGLAELYERVYREVWKQTRGEQSPVLKGQIIGLGMPRLSGEGTCRTPSRRRRSKQ